MRFSEFKVIVKEAADQPPSYVSIGDSHAKAVGQMGGSKWLNLGINGKTSKDPNLLANISKIPKGSVVLVGVGANDTANAMALTAQTGRPLRDPNAVAGDVSAFVDQVKAQGPSHIVFLLFPVGPGRGSALAQHYGGTDYQDKVRNAIKSSLSGITVIDQNGKPLQPDGIHSNFNVYKDAANEVMTKFSVGTNLGNPAADPAKVKTKDRAEGQPLKVGPPYPPETKAEVTAMQQALEKIGYNVGPMGADGKFGPYTSAALGAFKSDYNLGNDSKVFADADKDTLDKVQSGAIARVKEPTPVNKIMYAGADPKGGVGATANAVMAVKFFISKGWTPEQAAGIVGNLQAEVGANLRTDLPGDGGKAYGVAQWHPDRQRKFAEVMKRDIRASGLEEQLAFVDWELKNSQNVAPWYAGDKLKAAKTAEEAAWIVDQFYERSSGQHRQKRMSNALALAAATSTTA
jgi:peptidoglycan hydrolase-like protein with peptidoglycan-binding domain